MSVVVSGNITQSPNGNVLTFTDTSTGVGSLTSRTLVIFDPNGSVLANINMGSSLTATYDIVIDGWFSFVETIVDNTGTYVLTVNYLSAAFYQNAFANAVAAQNCPSCDYFNVFFNLNRSQDSYAAAVRFFIGGFAIAAQTNILQANFYVATPYYA